MTNLARHFGTNSSKFIIHFGRPIPRFVDDSEQTWPHKHLRGHLRPDLSMSFEKSENTIPALRQILQSEGGGKTFWFFHKHRNVIYYFDVRKIFLIFLFVLLFWASKLKIPMCCSFHMCTAGDGISQEVESGPHRHTALECPDAPNKCERIRIVQHQPIDCCICLGYIGIYR